MTEKSMQSSFTCEFSVKVEEVELSCVFDESHQRSVFYTKQEKEIQLTCLSSVTEVFPEIFKERNASIFAKLVNFFLKGSEFHVIECPKTYQSNYKDSVERQKNSLNFDLNNLSLICYGEYDVKEVTEPKIVKKEQGDQVEKIVFYVTKKGQVGIPYKVTCLLPIKDELNCSYETLPFVDCN